MVARILHGRLRSALTAGPSVPPWLSFPLVFYVFAIGWLILVQWRSRRNSEDGSGHGWIWQIVQRFWPRRWLNRAAIIIFLVAFVIASMVTYVDRFIAADLGNSQAVFIVEATVIVPLDVRVIAVVIGWSRAYRNPAESVLFHFWKTIVGVVFATSMVGTFISVGDEMGLWTGVPVMLFFLIFFPGWAIASIADRLRRRHDDSHANHLEIGRPSWW